MPKTNLNRRRFHGLTMAAFGGLMAGAGSAAAQEGRDQKGQTNVDPSLLLQEPHVCRGLNTCMNKGKGKQNACAGQGSCAVVEAHACHGHNECKGQGGCGGYPGQNTCKAKGHCAVPLSDTTWAIARKQYEHLMKELDKEFGAAPKKGQ